MWFGAGKVHGFGPSEVLGTLYACYWYFINNSTFEKWLTGHQMQPMNSPVTQSLTADVWVGD